MLGFLTTIIHSVNKSSVKKKLKAKKDAEDKIEKAQKSSDIEENSSNITAKDIRDANSNPNKLSTWITGVISKAVCLIEAIPITVVAIQLLAIILVICILAVIIFSVLSMVASTLIDTVVLEAGAFDFTNPYMDGFSLSREMDEYGTWRTVVKPRGTSLSVGMDTGGSGGGSGGAVGSGGGGAGGGSNEEPPPPIYLDDTTDDQIWCGLSDDQIFSYIGEQFGAETDNAVFACNMYRLIRMAYRICYAKDDKGERYLKGIEPATLVGIVAFEKGISWLGRDSAGYGWYRYDDTKNGWVKIENVLTAGGALRYYWNVDFDISGYYMTKKVGGPFSYTGMQVGATDYVEGNTLVASALVSLLSNNANYLEVYKQLLTKYSSYQVYKKILPYDSLPASSDISSDVNDVVIGSLFMSMLYTALRFDKEWYNGTHSLGDGSSRFIKDLLGTNGYSVYVNDVNSGAVKGASQSEENLVNFYVDMLSHHSDLSYESIDSTKMSASIAKSLANVSFYAYHHLPNAMNDWGNMRQSMSPPEGTEDKAYYNASRAVLYYDFLRLANYDWGNIDFGFKNSYDTNGGWLPGVDYDASQYKGTVAGNWMDGDVYNPTWCDTEELLNEVKSLTRTDNGEHSYPFAKVGSTQLSQSYWAEVIDRYEDNSGSDFWLACLAVPDKCTYPNMHALSIEGLYGVGYGVTIVDQCLNAILAAGLSGMVTSPVTGGGNVTTDYSKYLGGNGQIVLLGGSYIPLNAENTDYVKVGEDFATGEAKHNIATFLVNGNSGIQDMHINHPIGQYIGGRKHKGLDILSPQGTTDNHWYRLLEMSKKTESSTTGSSAVMSHSEYIDKYEANGYTEADYWSDLLPVIAPFDGFITRVDCGWFAGDVSLSTTGNTVYLEGALLQADGKTYEVNEIYIGHLAPNSMLAWLELDEGVFWDAAVQQSENAKSGKYQDATVTVKSLRVPIHQGDIIGYIGSTGCSSASHQHIYFGFDKGSDVAPDDPAHKGEKCCMFYFGALVCETEKHYPFVYSWFNLNQGNSPYTFKFDTELAWNFRTALEEVRQKAGLTAPG